MPAPDWEIEKFTLPGQPISASGYNPAVAVNDFVFVAGNMALLDTGELPPAVRIRPTARWGGQTGFRRQVAYTIKERLEPSLKAAGSALENCLKAQAYVRGTDNFADFMDVWSQHFRDIPCALTVVPAKDYASAEGMIEINLIALKNGATRRKQVVSVDMPAMATFGPCVRAGELVFPSGMMAVGRDGARARGRVRPRRSTGFRSRARRKARCCCRYAEAVCKAVNVPMRNVVRAQYFLHRHARFRRRRGGVVGPLRQAAASVRLRSGAGTVVCSGGSSRRRLLDLRRLIRRSGRVGRRRRRGATERADWPCARSSAGLSEAISTRFRPRSLAQ